MFRTAVGQLLWVSQLRVDISYIKGTTHYKVSLAPKAQRVKKDRSQSTSTHMLTVTGLAAQQQERIQVEQLHHAEAELYAMGQATIEAQHIKQVIEELAITNLSPHITMSINTDSSAGGQSTWTQQEDKTRTIALLVHCTTWTTHHQQDTHNANSSRRLDKTPSINNTSITSRSTLSTDYNNHNSSLELFLAFPVNFPLQQS
eukprot:3066548-Amphidinium_carterae.3